MVKSTSDIGNIGGVETMATEPAKSENNTTQSLIDMLTSKLNQLKEAGVEPQQIDELIKTLVFVDALTSTLDRQRNAGVDPLLGHQAVHLLRRVFIDMNKRGAVPPSDMLKVVDALERHHFNGRLMTA